jgi:hypothetical protein
MNAPASVGGPVGLTLRGDAAMARESCEVKVKVLAVSRFREFRGTAMVAGINPKFVISLILDEHSYQPADSSVTLPVHTVATFAIDSVVRLFIESDIVGRECTLRIDTEVINGIKRYFLRLA